MTYLYNYICALYIHWEGLRASCPKQTWRNDVGNWLETFFIRAQYSLWVKTLLLKYTYIHILLTPRKYLLIELTNKFWVNDSLNIQNLSFTINQNNIFWSNFKPREKNKNEMKISQSIIEIKYQTIILHFIFPLH